MASRLTPVLVRGQWRWQTPSICYTAYFTADGDVMRLMLCLLGFCLPALSVADVMPPLNLLTDNYPPFNMPGDKPGEVRGISTEIVQQLLARIGRPYQIRLYPWQRALSAAQNTPDSCVFSTSRTPERESLYSWVGPLAETSWALFAYEADPSTANLSNIEDVRDKRIGSSHGDAIVTWLQSYGYRVDVAPRDDINPRKLLAGRIDLWASGRLAGQYILHQQQIRDIVPRLTFNRSSMYLACNRDLPSDEVKRLNHELQHMREDGSISAIYKRNGYTP